MDMITTNSKEIKMEKTRSTKSLIIRAITSTICIAVVALIVNVGMYNNRNLTEKAIDYGKRVVGQETVVKKVVRVAAEIVD